MTENGNTITVSIIVAAYNEESSVLQILQQIKEQAVAGFEFEVLVIDDGSTDRTAELLKQNPDLYHTLIEMKFNGGKGAAVIAGLRRAKGDYILFQDADLEYDPAEYAKLLSPVSRFDADIVMGSRLVASPMTRVSYFWHRVGNRFITFLFNVMNNTTFTDIYSCYLLYRRALVDPERLKTRGWEQHAEILSLATRRAKSIYEVPISYFGRSYGEGKKIRGHHAFSVIWTIIRMRIAG